MTEIAACVVGDEPFKLWGLTPRERLRRQFKVLKNLTVVETSDALPEAAAALVARGAYVVETRALEQLLARPGVALRCPTDGRAAVVFARPGQARQALALLSQDAEEAVAGAAAAGLQLVEPAALAGYDPALQRAAPPLLEPVSEDRRQALEDRLYDSAYKGVTDLVTKWLWPRPAKAGARFCAAAGITPNAVTLLGLALMLAACGLFHQGQFAAGLAAGWFMTYLDTVDGKLARVTAQSSKLGHVLDHGMDIIHPPFWYALWGMALAPSALPWGLDLADACWVLVAGYVAGRLAEQIFLVLGGCAMFTWRPFDSWFRLVTARRNPCLIILTAACLAGRPDWGFIGVTLWTVATTAVLTARLAQGLAMRVRHGPLRSWLADREAAARHPLSLRVFAGPGG